MLGSAACTDLEASSSNTFTATPSINLENSSSVGCNVFFHYPYRGLDGCRNGIGGRGLLKASLFNHLKNQHYKGFEGLNRCRERIGVVQLFTELGILSCCK